MMEKVQGRFKKYSVAALTMGLATAFFIQPAKADWQDATDLPPLTNIQNYTNSILTAVNNIPAYLTQITQMAMSLLATDNKSSDPVDWSASWSNEQNWLATLGTAALTNEASQYSMQQNLLTTFFGSANVTSSPPNPANLNDLSYLTLLGQPLVSPDQRQGVNAAMNYLTNASGLGIPLVVPVAGWRGDATSQTNYLHYYNTMTAVQTYNGFVLSRLYQDSQTEAQTFPLRQQLITQSSNSSWFSSVISNDLGWVLRQILLYNSQMYVLMDQLLQTQKQMAATLAMTNTLFLVNNEMQGNFLLKQAQGTTS